MIDDITLFFEKFGNLNSVEIRQRESVHYGLVEFEIAENAGAVLSKDLLRIGGCDFQVETPNRYSENDRENDSFRKLFYHLSQRFLTISAIGSADDFHQFDHDTTVYLTNYDIPIRTLYIAPIKIDVSIPSK